MTPLRPFTWFHIGCAVAFASGAAASDAAAPNAAPHAAPAAQGGATADAERPTPRARARRLVREGAFLTNRRGRLERVGRNWTFVFDRDARGGAEPTMILQPGQRLTEMERLVESRADPVTFLISGEVFVYRNENYLLPLGFSVVATKGAEPEAPAPDAKPAGAPTAEGSAPVADSSIERMIERVEQASAPRGGASLREARPPMDFGAASSGLRREGEFIASRRARIQRAPSGQFIATFDNDPPPPPAPDAAEPPPAAPPDPPLTLMACSALSRIEALADRAPQGFALTISGQVFLYDGENYLLPTLFVLSYADAAELRPGQ